MLGKMLGENFRPIFSRLTYAIFIQHQQVRHMTLRPYSDYMFGNSNISLFNSTFKKKIFLNSHFKKCITLPFSFNHKIKSVKLMKIR